MDSSIIQLYDGTTDLNRWKFMKRMNVHPAFIHRIEKQHELVGHNGCVNRIAWNERGTKLVTGSDDLHIGIWDYPSGTRRHFFQTAHEANIFGVRFLTDDAIVSGAMDFTVQHHKAPFQITDTTVYCCHKGRVKDVEVERGGSGDIWWSASEDGTVRQFDRRLPHAGCSSSYVGSNFHMNTQRDYETSKNVLILAMRPKSYRSGRLTLKVMGLAVSPVEPWLMAVACGDEQIRMYDRRKLSLVSHTGENTSGTNYWLSFPALPSFGPPHVAGEGDRSNRQVVHSTHVSFSPDGRKVIASFHSDHVYSFDIKKLNFDRLSKAEQSISSYEIPFPPAGIDRQDCEHNHDVEAATDKEGDLVLPSSTTNEIMKLSNKIKAAHKEMLRCFLRTNNRPMVRGNGSQRLRLDLSPESLAQLYGSRADCLGRRGWVGDYYLALLDSVRARALCNYDWKSSLQVINILHLAGMKLEAEHEIGAFQSKFPEHRERAVQYQASSRVPSPRRSSSRRDTSGTARVVITMDDGNRPVSGRLRSRSDEGQYHLESDRASDRSVDDEPAPSTSKDFAISFEEKCAVIWRKCLAGEVVNDVEYMNLEELKRPHLFEERYIGSRNFATDVKEASFFGENHVVAGSDDGRVFVWEKDGGRLVHAFVADGDIVNCVRPHPHLPVLASSGIDNTVKIWSPIGPYPAAGFETRLAKIQTDNQQPANTMPFFGRMLRQILTGMVERNERFDMEVDNSQFECIQS